jgi:hypothetical protein
MANGLLAASYPFISACSLAEIIKTNVKYELNVRDKICNETPNVVVEWLALLYGFWQISARRQAAPTEIFRGFTLPLQANAGVVP